MIHNCLECKKINYIFQSDLKLNGEYKNVFNMTEYIFSYSCFDCGTNNMLFTDFLCPDYSVNLFLYSQLNLEIVELNLQNFYTSNTISAIKNIDELLFHKVSFADTSIRIENTVNIPLGDGEYIISLKDSKKKLNKLYSIKYEKSKLILF